MELQTVLWSLEFSWCCDLPGKVQWPQSKTPHMHSHTYHPNTESLRPSASASVTLVTWRCVTLVAWWPQYKKFSQKWISNCDGIMYGTSIQRVLLLWVLEWNSNSKHFRISFLVGRDISVVRHGLFSNNGTREWVIVPAVIERERTNEAMFMLQLNKGV